MEDSAPNGEGKITVTHNGSDKEFLYRPNELAEVLLTEAKVAFGVASQHLLGLFTEGGLELKDKESLESQGVRADQLLVLRQSEVRGGA
jgi:hypothetical protein